MRDGIEREFAAGPLACLMMDEAQFLTHAQVAGLARTCDVLDVPVLAYGLRTDFRSELFEGAVRLLRVGEQMRHILSEILARGDVHDATLAKHLVSVTEVRMSPDLRHATVFVKPLLGQEEEAVLKALRSNTAYLQREVARRVEMKYAAKLKFMADENSDEGAHVDTLLQAPEVTRI